MEQQIDLRGTSASLAKLAEALAKAQGAMAAAKKDSTNPHFKSRYADLAAVWEAIRAPLAENGLSVLQRVSTSQEGVTVETMLLHASGEWVQDRCWMPVAQQTPQGFGSAITYARRYSLSALVGVAADEDDDGNAASTGGGHHHRGPPRESHQERLDREEAHRRNQANPARNGKPPAPVDQRAEALRVRRWNLWAIADKKLGMDPQSFQAWAAEQLGEEKPSKEWTEEEIEKIEVSFRRWSTKVLGAEKLVNHWTDEDLAKLRAGLPEHLRPKPAAPPATPTPSPEPHDSRNEADVPF